MPARFSDELPSVVVRSLTYIANRRSERFPFQLSTKRDMGAALPSTLARRR
jgi:hypothetical protein